MSWGKRDVPLSNFRKKCQPFWVLLFNIKSWIFNRWNLIFAKLNTGQDEGYNLLEWNIFLPNITFTPVWLNIHILQGFIWGRETLICWIIIIYCSKKIKRYLRFSSNSDIKTKNVIQWWTLFPLDEVSCKSSNLSENISTDYNFI